MPSTCGLAARLLSRHAVGWLLIVLVALQGINVSFSGAQGPSHVHREVTRPLVLEDVRRAGPPTSRGELFGGWRGHSHGASLRHHHSSADPTVVVEAADAALAAAEEISLAHDLAVAAFVAVLMLAFWWAPAALSQQRALRTLWQPSFVTARLLERPPQPA